MQTLLRCGSCRSPLSIKEDEILKAIEFLNTNRFKYYNVSCPSCGKLTKVPRAQLEKTAPRAGGGPKTELPDSKGAQTKAKAATSAKKSPQSKTTKKKKE